MARPIGLDEALAILEIQRVLHTNFRATDAKDWDLFETTLADEVAIEFVGLQPATTVTRRQLRTQSEPNYAHLRTQHISTNLDVRVEGATATSTSYGRARHEYVGRDVAIAAEGPAWHIYARYENGYALTDDGWKIDRIVMEPLWQDGDSGLLARAAQAGA